MSDRKRDKNSKSTYMRAARKQRMIENQFMQEIEKAQEAPASKYSKNPTSNAASGMMKSKEECNSG